MKKIRIQRVSRVSMLLALLLAAVLTAVSVVRFRTFQSMRSATTRYVTAERSAEKLQKGSDTLTEQARLFVMTGSKKYMDGYFQEADVTRQRDQAVEELETYFSGTQVLSNLEAALSDSRVLMEREYYAMRLAASGYAMEVSGLPQKVAEVELETMDQVLTNAEKLRKAERMVSDDSYQDAKTRISENVDRCVEDLVHLTEGQQNESYKRFRGLYVAQELGLAVMVVFFVGESLVVRRLVVRPLVSYNAHIQRDETVPVEGAAELQSLAVTYNRVYEENQEAQRLLRHEAEHDALSSLLNRASFNRLLALYQKDNVSYALVLTDIDGFKRYNDTYGHTVGDRIIQKAARKLTESFRDADFVFRVGGDEFAVIMTEVTQEKRYVVKECLDKLKQSLTNQTDGCPALTMSAGIAFSGGDTPEADIYQRADNALYYVKRHGRNGAWFYGDEV